MTTTPNSLVTPQLLTRGILQFIQGVDLPNVWKTLYTSNGTAGFSRTYSVWATNSDSIDHVVTIGPSSTGFANIAHNTVTVPSLSGYGIGKPPVSLLWPGLPIDQYGNPYFQMIQGDLLEAYITTALVSATSRVNLYSTVAEF